MISIAVVANLTGDEESTASTEKVPVEKEPTETESCEKEPVEKEPVEQEPTDKELAPISNADLDRLAPGRHLRDVKSERTIDFDNKSMDM